MEEILLKNINLVDLKVKERGVVKDISGGREARKRLCELGLNRGAKVEMVKNDLGPLILNLSGNKLALGRGLATSITVEM